jgi:hypothetical protein
VDGRPGRIEAYVKGKMRWAIEQLTVVGGGGKRAYIDA